MPNLTADEIVTLRHKRTYIQFGGARPTNTVRYGGQNSQYMALEGLSISEIGGIDPIWVPDPRKIGAYRLVGRSFSPADLPTVNLKMFERHGSIPRQLTRIGCQFNMYELTGSCEDLSDFVQGWSDYVLIYSGGIVTDKDGGARTAWDSDEAIEDSLSVTLSAVYPIGSLAFGEKAASSVDREVVDVVYGSKESCGDCSPSDDGSNRIYFVVKSSGAGSPGYPAELIYTTDGGLTWDQTTITGFGATEDPLAIDIVGNYLVIIGSAAYFWAQLNTVTGIPGTFTKVTSGFVSGKAPTDIYVASPREVYFSGNGGYVYKTEDITTGVTTISDGSATSSNLLRIHGKDDVLVAVGATGAIIKSVNRGATWTTTTTSPEAINSIVSVWVMDKNLFWVGTETSGNLWYTLNGGETWVSKAFSGSGSGTVYDIVFPTAEVGFIAHMTTTPAGRLFTTWNGGADITNLSPRILNMPVCDRINRIACPDVDASIAANNVALAGLAGNGTDGIALVGTASRL